MSEASEAEIAQDLEERISENPLAYSENKLEFLLTKDDVEKLKQNRDWNEQIKKRKQ